MKVFLLAAGRGTRISKSIPDVPKCTLPVNGIPLICRTVDMLTTHGFDVTIVTGYRCENIFELMKNRPVRVLYNPFFDVTNSIASLWFAREWITDEECIIANADVFWSEDILNLILDRPKNVFMLSDVRRRADGDYFFQVKDGIIRKYGKQLTYEERTEEYVGIAYLSSSIVPVFKKRLNEMIYTQQHGFWWENVLYSMVDEINLYALDVGERFWAEIDFIEDYQRIIHYAEEHNEV